VINGEKMKKVIFTGEYITLGQFLKKVDLIDSGSDAKHFLSFNRVFINDEVDERRGRKLRNQDQVRIGKEIWILINED
jgi:ribosome-associated protein